MNRAKQLLDNLLKDGRKADAIEYALVATAIVLTAVACEAYLINRIGREFNMIINSF